MILWHSKAFVHTLKLLQSYLMMVSTKTTIHKPHKADHSAPIANEATTKRYFMSA